jgi:hypothetical protein
MQKFKDAGHQDSSVKKSLTALIMEQGLRLCKFRYEVYNPVKKVFDDKLTANEATEDENVRNNAANLLKGYITDVENAMKRMNLKASPIEAAIIAASMEQNGNDQEEHETTPSD